MTSPRVANVLVVDDEPHLRELLVDTLAGPAVRVSAAGSGREAIELAEHQTHTREVRSLAQREQPEIQAANAPVLAVEEREPDAVHVRIVGRVVVGKAELERSLGRGQVGADQEREAESQSSHCGLLAYGSVLQGTKYRRFRSGPPPAAWAGPRRRRKRRATPGRILRTAARCVRSPPREGRGHRPGPPHRRARRPSRRPGSGRVPGGGCPGS